MIAPLLLALFAQPAEASPTPDWLKVQARIDSGDGGSAIKVGEPFRLVIEAEHAPGSLALLPEEVALGDQLAERKNARRHTRSGDQTKETDRYELEILAFDSGEVTIPKIPLALGSTHAETKPIALDVASHFSEAEMPIATSTQAEAMPELEKMAAADPDARTVLVDDYRAIWIAAIVLALMAIVLITRAVLKRKRAAEDAQPIPEPPPRPAHEVAFERLEALRKSGLVEKGDLKTYFVELSEIVRAYAGARWTFDSLDLTIDELMIALSRHDTRGLEARKLESLLMRADLVKFAKYTPDAAEATDAMGSAMEIVDRTKPQIAAGSTVERHVAA